VDLDIAMMVRREGAPGPQTPDGILTRCKGTRIGEIVKAIESRPDPGTINLGLTLLMLSEHAVVSLSNVIDRIARQSEKDGRHHVKKQENAGPSAAAHLLLQTRVQLLNDDLRITSVAGFLE
jgi:hypothetical protein